MFERLKTFLTKNSYSRSFTNWFGLANWEDGRLFNMSNLYNANAYVNIAVNKIATNLVRADFKLFSETDKEITTGPVYKLFNFVNPMMSTAQLIEATASWALTRGESIWILSGRNPGTLTGVPVRIDVVEPLYMEHVLNKEKTEIVLWKFKKDGEEIPFLPTEIIHFKQWNAIDPWRGVNPLIAAEPELLSDVLINTSNNTLLKNNGVPTGLLTSKESITAVQAQEIKDMWDKSHGGVNKKGKTAVLGSGTEYKQLALTSSDMEYFKSKQWNRGVILGRYGVPAIVAGYRDDSTPLSGSDTNEQMQFFWNQTLIPMLTFLESKLDTEFSKRFAPTIKIRFDISKIAELQDNLEELAKRVREDVKAGILTQNEGRVERGLEPVTWGDTWWREGTLIDVTEPIIPQAPVKNNLTIFNKPVPEERWPELFIKQHIFKVESNNKILANYLHKELKDWLYAQRSNVLENLSAKGEVNPLFWEMQKTFLVNRLLHIMDNIRQTVVKNIGDVVNVYDVDFEFVTKGICGDDYAISRLSDYVKDFVSDSIINRDMDGTREKYKIAQARLHEVADREIEIIVNDMRTKIFTTLNLDKSLWIQLDKPIKEATGLGIFNKDITVHQTIPKKALTIIEKNEEDVEEAVEEFYNNLEPKVKSDTKNFKTPEAFIAYFAALKVGSAFVKHMNPVIKNVWVNGAKNVYSDLGKVYDLSIKKSAEYIKARGLFLKKSPDFVMDSIVNMIESKGDISIEDLTADIVNKWDDITESRAALIAKTETSEALATGAEDAMLELDIPYKRWVNMGDDKVREEHQDSATGVYAKVGKDFKNGLFGPGGYNCRCWLEPATAEEARGK